MSPLDLDPRLTFESYVIGAANRLATAAAKRVAETPGRSYNPLFLYGSSGLGKTHLLTAMGHHARKLHPELPVAYDSLEHLMEEIIGAIEAGDRDAFLGTLGGAGLLLVDDVQFLAGRHRTQEELLRAWDHLSASGGQIVLASDRPPPEIDGLDERLLSRFSGGLIVDIGAPDYETRVAIVRRKVEERGHTLLPDVPEALARIVFGNVRELQGALNRVIATEELQGRAVTPGDLADVLGRAGVASTALDDEFDSFLADLSDTVESVLTGSPAEQRLEAAITRWRDAGWRTRALELSAGTVTDEEEAETLVRHFEAEIDRLRAIEGELQALDPAAPELSRQDVLRDPDMLAEAEAMLAEVRERTHPLPAPPPEHTFETLSLAADLMAVRAARAVAEQPGVRYNPLYIHGPDRTGKTALLAALGNRLATNPGRRVAFVRGSEFATELIHALEKNRVESWRGRYRRASAFLFDDVDALAGTDRAQEELFHLFEALQRQGVQLAFTSDYAPGEISGVEDRLRTRLGSGLVVELPVVEASAQSDLASASEQQEQAAEAAVPGIQDDWFLSREKIVWDWPYAADLLVPELD